MRGDEVRERLRDHDAQEPVHPEGEARRGARQEVTYYECIA